MGANCYNCGCVENIIVFAWISCNREYVGSKSKALGNIEREVTAKSSADFGRAIAHYLVLSEGLLFCSALNVSHRSQQYSGCVNERRVANSGILLPSVNSPHTTHRRTPPDTHAGFGPKAAHDPASRADLGSQYGRTCAAAVQAHTRLRPVLSHVLCIDEVLHQRVGTHKASCPRRCSTDEERILLNPHPTSSSVCAVYSNLHRPSYLPGHILETDHQDHLL